MRTAAAGGGAQADADAGRLRQAKHLESVMSYVMYVSDTVSTRRWNPVAGGCAQADVDAGRLRQGRAL